MYYPFFVHLNELLCCFNAAVGCQHLIEARVGLYLHSF